MEVESGKVTKAPEIQAEVAETGSGQWRKIILVASIAAGVQFGWALQLSLLTPYVQLLGIPHKCASIIWLCGPISGMLVQPVVGYHSDRCTSRFGRRRPFIAAGVACVAIAVFLIGYAADLGHLFGDALQDKIKTRAIAIFIVGFWILDVANNMLQGPCRALLADLSSDNHKMMRTANSSFSFFMAVGNVLGYAAGSYTHLYKLFPFTRTHACDIYCANLKTCFFLSIALLVSLTVLALSLVREVPLPKLKKETESSEGAESAPFLKDALGAVKQLDKSMMVLLLVTCLNWIAWFPFLLYDTDWMGREVYGGVAGEKTYEHGVRAGALGLMLLSVVLGIMSLSMEVSARALGSVKRVWGYANFLLAICLAMTVLVTKLAESARRGDPSVASSPPAGIKAGALTLFAVMGIPQAVTFSIPFALASIYCTTRGAGQGLSLGVLNLAIVVPQMVVSLLSGPWDAVFGGGNLPAFVVGAVAAAVSAILALTILPSPPADVEVSKLAASGSH